MDVELWTAQGLGYSLIDDKYDVSRSSFAKDLTILRAYERLHKTVGTRPLVWCYSRMPDQMEHRNWLRATANWYHLRVPTTAIVGYVDDVRWENIIDRRGVPADLRSDLHQAAIDRQTASLSIADAYKQLEEEYWQRLGSKSDCWENLISQTPTAKYGSTALVRCPIHPSWVLKHPWLGPKGH